MAVNKKIEFSSLVGIAALALTACSGSVGGAGGQNEDAASGEGFEYGAEQSVVNEAIEDLEPVDLRFQVGVAPNTLLAPTYENFKEYVEERSNEKINLEIVWSNGVAGFDEVDDALADGRLDIAYTIPTYHQSEYPTYMGFGAMTTDTPAGPVAGEIVTMLAMSAYAMESDALHEEFTSKGLTVLTPAINTGQYNQWCGEPATESSDWQGRTISVPNTSIGQMMQDIGATPVSLEYSELFEGLQRNTVNCSTSTSNTADMGSIADVAPYVHTTEVGGIQRTASTMVAGTSFEELPTAYQQIIFDGEAVSLVGYMQALADTAEANWEAVQANGGDFLTYDSETEEILAETQESIVLEYVDSGVITEEDRAKVAEYSEKWQQLSSEAGVVDAGPMSEFGDWYAPEEFSFDDIAAQMMEDHYLERRPQY